MKSGRVWRAGPVAAILTCGALAPSPWENAAKAAEPVLERVVIVQRHGVRSPTQPPSTLARWSTRAWPAWNVAAGDLTPRGAQIVGLVGDGLRRSYAALLPETGCPEPGRVVLWADSADQRTRESGAALAAALVPGCPLPVGMRPSVAPKASAGAPVSASRRDPIFASLGGKCRLEETVARQAFEAASGGAMVDPQAAAAIAKLDTILRPSDPQLLSPQTTSTVKIQPTRLKIEGPLGIASTVSEIFLLQYANDLPAAQVGWGDAADPATLDLLLAAHRRAIQLARHLPYLAERRGGAMAALILDALAGDPGRAPPETGPQVKLLVLAGHDNNLSNMAGVFGLDWSLPGQPDPTAPATALAFELWRDPQTQAASVRVQVHYLTLAGMRALDAGGRAAVPVAIAGCSDGPGGSCPLDRLLSAVRPRIPAACAARG